MENTSSNRRIHIFYRHMHADAEQHSRDPNKRRPHWFGYEHCFRNLLTTIRNDPNHDRVSITLMFDGSMDQLLSDFSSRYLLDSGVDIKLQLITAGSDKNSTLITLYCANNTEMQDNDIVYMLENDYVHQHGWVSKVFELYDSGISFDYVSLYDHPDKYFHDIYKGLRSRVVHSASHHWRTAPSSCASYMCEVSRFRSDYDALMLCLPDYFLFKGLTEQRGRVLLTPLPGLSTHCMEGYMTPVVAWESLVS